ncbi:DUF1778 domain-containing protein [Vibrio aestuarianus]|uniref:DUF1778 domain-containing protein n=1 Tax=Vibrio aestuarianus TaxID=28171 RepID=A0A9X4FHR6_9VIBR|nr:DUF1778 domain-containing protein [Vibrio aestuarianus]MDE1358980.1 DUF1778 domain-containing protein [Vibrio aestuarianus]
MRCSHLNRALYSPSFRKLSVRIECALSLDYNLSGYGMYPYAGGVMATARLDIRLDEEIKAKAEKASALLGLKSLTEYVVRLMDEDATHVIEEHESIVVKDSVFDEFMAACNKVKTPNQALLEAVKFTDKSGIK